MRATLQNTTTTTNSFYVLLGAPPGPEWCSSQFKQFSYLMEGTNTQNNQCYAFPEASV